MPDQPPRVRPGRRHGIRWRAAVLAGAGGLIPMALGAWAGWQALREAARPLAAERRLLAATVAAAVDQRLEEDLGTLALLSAGRGFAGTAGPDRNALHLARLRSRRLETVFVTGADGSVESVEPVASAPLALPPAWAAEVASALRSGRPGVTDVLRGDEGEAVLLLVPFLDAERGARGLVGGVVARPAQSYAPRLGPGRPDSGASVEVVDGRGAIVAGGPGPTGGEGGGSAAEEVATAALSAAPWRVIVRQPRGGAAAAFFSRRLLVLAPAVLGTALLFAWGAARSLTRPLAALVGSAGRIAAGDLQHPIPQLGTDEVGQLARSFEAMRAALARSIDALERDREELEGRVAERTRELAGLYDELRERDERRGQLIRKTISAQEDERMRIARELHDETCQSLAALLMRFDAVLAGPALGGEARERLLEARSLASRALDEVHRIIFDLRPSVLDDLGLVPAIQWFAARHLQPRGIAVRCELEGMEARLPRETETALFRAVQEALTNVARHARAETVLLQIARRGDVLEIEIEDDGIGFDPATVAGPAASGRGLGLLGIRERIELLGGDAQIESSAGRGTRVVIRVPLAEPALAGGGGSA